MMRSIKVKDYMTDYVLSFDPETELFKAIKALRQRQVTSAPVIDKEGKLVGVLAQWNCLGRMLHGSYFEEVGGSVRDFMCTDMITTKPEDDIVDVADAMLERQWHYCIPVLDGSRLVGVLSCSDILQMVYDFESGPKSS
jgi:CBS domain-containing protein